jgi:hypothetical protein
VRRRSEVDRLRVTGIRGEMLRDGIGIEMGTGIDRRQQIIDGEPVELNALELPPLARRYEQLGFQPFDRLRILPDDTIELVALQPPVPPMIDGEEPWEP